MHKQSRGRTLLQAPGSQRKEGDAAGLGCMLRFKTWGAQAGERNPSHVMLKTQRRVEREEPADEGHGRGVESRVRVPGDLASTTEDAGPETRLLILCRVGQTLRGIWRAETQSPGKASQAVLSQGNRNVVPSTLGKGPRLHPS